MRTGTASTATIIFVIIIIAGCSLTNKKNSSEYAEGTREGYELAKQYCSSCHQFVAAALLNKSTWRTQVLPDMAHRLGITVLWHQEYVNDNAPGALLSFSEWTKIVDYYTRTAPEKMESTGPVAPVADSSLFSVKAPTMKFAEPVRTVMVAADTSANIIYTGDGYTNRIYKWNTNLKLADSALVFSPPVNAYFFDEQAKHKAVFTIMGTMQAEDIRNGLVLKFDISRNLEVAPDTLASGMPRSIVSQPGDFNNDGRTDWLVCGFGQASGGLYWLKNIDGHKYSTETILSIPGATQAVIEDLNDDGWDDIMVLFAHSDESIKLLLNDKKGGFHITTLLSFPPVYGSSGFQLVDLNNDGLRDILYTCGDNADVSQVLKPFHGVYIYLNKGNNKYEQSYFYHINGCTKAIANDFDQDGDLDIATINFYADYEGNPAETFIYLRQGRPMKFEALSPKIDRYGRWLTMDVADYDSDGDMDIILGNFAKDFFIDKNFTPQWNLYLPFIVLENKLK